MTVALQQGVGGYHGAEDTYLSSYYRPPQNPKDLSFGGAPELAVFDRTGGGGEHTRSLLRFDLSRVRGRIVGAQLVLTKSRRSPNGEKYFNQTIALHRVADAGWQAGSSNLGYEEDVATWGNRSEPRTPWAGQPGLMEPGVDYVAAPLATAQTGVELNSAVTLTLNDASFLNEWAADPVRNAGFLLR